ncbi:protease inhibitor I42 family protein [Niabella drilacis]|uniref:Predicted secreted protein n=1 Tax=Niabella drilacis (strain DSM 25811 / CCM 8410 / CCUG 62505 / LMG 26954 / E90) TaxID=1285928 RepID=A0A1G6Q094_NIADE|nr:protease inhibitor I42 family protein [Niabella drilacis]SDC85641.1 Predicted secreted protein [Niabella drilacis]
MRTINLKTGAVYSLQLDSLGGAGYSWVVEQNNESVAAIRFHTLATPDAIRKSGIGGAVKVEVVIKGLQPGNAHVRLAQKRVWETEEKPLAIEELLVTVTG